MVVVGPTLGKPGLAKGEQGVAREVTESEAQYLDSKEEKPKVVCLPPLPLLPLPP